MAEGLVYQRPSRRRTPSPFGLSSLGLGEALLAQNLGRPCWIDAAPLADWRRYRFYDHESYFHVSIYADSL